MVVVGSLYDAGGGEDDIGRELASHFPRPPYEPPGRVADFDAMRQRYVAFSRAQHLLVLTASGPPAPRFAAIRDGLPRWPHLDDSARNKLLSQRFAPTGLAADPVPPANLVIQRVRRLVVRPGQDQPASVKPC